MTRLRNIITPERVDDLVCQIGGGVVLFMVVINLIVAGK